MEIKTVCAFCGASNDAPQHHLQLAWDLGVRMAEQGHALVYGGGDCGMMGKVANGVLHGGGWVTGVFPEHLKEFEKEHYGLSENIVVDSMHTRKDLMYKKSDAFIVLPGGFGTMDEFFEILTWKQLQLHTKPIFIFNYEGYWEHMIKLADNIIDNGFAKEEVRSFFEVFNTMDELLDRLKR